MRRGRIRELIFGHRCLDYLEHKSVAFYNTDPNADPMPLSIYGPFGSYRLDLWQCTICKTCWGKRYDTFGGSDMTPEDAERIWKEQDKLQKGTKQQEEVLI